MRKLNVLLAITDQLRSKQKAMVSDYNKFFEKKQGHFLGERKTFTAKDGMLDDSSKRSYVRIVTTVNEKLDYLIKESKEFIDALFSQERTNSMGVATAKLIVEGKEWGEFTSLELLRLKTLLESSDYGDIKGMIASIPVKTEGEVWEKCENEEYSDRKVFQTELIKGETKTTEKEQYVLEDPNLKNIKDTSNYQSPIAIKNIVVITGDYTIQQFTGEWSHVQRTEALNRRTKLLTSVIEALKVANNVDSQKSELTAEKIFEFILKGSNS